MQILSSYTATLNKKERRQAQKGPCQWRWNFSLYYVTTEVGLLEGDLAARFRISQSLVSRIIVTWTKFMHYRFKELDIFPDRQIIELHKPAYFKNKYKGTTLMMQLKCT